MTEIKAANKNLMNCLELQRFICELLKIINSLALEATPTAPQMTFNFLKIYQFLIIKLIVN